MAEVAQDIKAIFKVRRGKTARELAKGFVELYGPRFPKAVFVFEAGIEDALSYLRYPGKEQRAVGTETLPHDGCPRGAGKTEPTTFETLM